MNTMTDMQSAGLHEEQAHYAALKELGQALKRSGYRFTTVSPATHARVNGRAGNEWAKDLAGVFGWSRPFNLSMLPNEVLALMRTADVMVPHGDGGDAFRSRLRASSLDEELFFHSAYPTTEADSVFFGPDTYRFANAIEQFISLHGINARRVIDIGCGAGPGAIVAAKRLPAAEILATDVNPAALRLAALNAELAGTSNVLACFSNLLKDVPGNFDLILSNPPYLVDPGKRAYRHGGGELGAEFSLNILKASLERLNPGGTLLLYTGVAMVDGVDPFRKEVADILRGETVKWTYHEMDPDIFGEELECAAYAQADRIAAVVLQVTRSV
ncbi:MAG: methyltransferase [Burkholderiaceae bacterium]